MSEHKSRIRVSRRHFLAGTAVAAAAGVTGFPAIVKAQGKTLKVGVLHPVTGPLAPSGQQCRLGAKLAIDTINANGGIASLGGAKIEPIYADAQSKPDVGVAEVEKLNEAGVSAIVGPFASGIALATTQAAAKHNIPHIVDVGVVDQVVTRGLKNTFRFGPGLSKIVDTAIENLVSLNNQAGKPAKTVMIVHEESAFGSGMAKTLNERLPAQGFEILETIPHANPTRDFNNIVLKIKARNPDILIPSNYYNEFVLLARTLRQQKVRPKAIYSILGGAASQYRFVKEFPEAAEYIMDCNHWFDPRNPVALELKKKVEAEKAFFSYEVFLDYECIRLLADAVERAASTDRAAITHALEVSGWSNTFMPYGPTKFVNGQNVGAAPVNTQIQGGDIKVIFPKDFANAKPVFPAPKA
ncbi:ABC transporter substrate-binding protein [Ferrovibrio sp.]|uniref:ABC transporter substrate-binding protein n=1 Tax=Ferrovibrio sp. TaxID=1917215 RepID=UPI00351744CC